MTAMERVRVGEVLRLERREVEIDPAAEYRLVGIYSFGKGILHREPKPGLELGDYRFFRIEPGDLVLSNIQAWEGAIAYATDLDQGTIGTHRFLSYIPIDGRIDANWARWFFLSEAGMEGIRRAAPGTAVRNRTLAVKRFEDLVIPLPPIDEQRRIAARLDHARVVSGRAAELAARSVTLATALLSSITLSEGEADRWPRVMLGAVLTTDLHQTPVAATATYEVAGVYSFGRGLFARGRIDGSQTSYQKLNRLAAGQLVMSRLKAWEGALATVDDRYDGWYLSPEFPTFTPDVEAIDPRFLNAVVTSKPFWSALGGSSKGIGARRERVHAERLLEQEIPLPPIEVQRQLAKSISNLKELESARLASEAHLAAILPSLLNREFEALT